MVDKLKIAQNWLPRYTGSNIDELGDYILLTNFKNYVTAFAKRFDCEIKGDQTIWEKEPLDLLAFDKKLGGSKHNKFWHRFTKCCFDNGPFTS